MKRSILFGYTVATVSSLLLLIGCDADTEGREAGVQAASSCVKCHNGSKGHDYNGPGIQNPHPFPGADNLTCVTCHGGNNKGIDRASSHVPPPPEIGDREFQDRNATAYFNKLTLTGIDKFPDYQHEGTTYRALDFLQFINPGDLRVVNARRACGQCHENHVDKVSGSVLATETGVFSGAIFAIGANNSIPGHEGLFQDTAPDLAFRPVAETTHVHDETNTSVVGHLEEFPVFSGRKDEGPGFLFKNQDITADSLIGDLLADNRVETQSNLAKLFQEQVAFTCGDCHLGSAGANNRTGDYRSSGCTACHMPYSVNGRSTSRDPNVPKNEPLDPDDIDDPERPHIRSHRIVSVKKTLANGTEIQGIDDYTCAGCHQGSNRTVMQYWGIRLDQNQDVRNKRQYPANPVKFVTTRNDPRLFKPEWENREFNGRNANQYLLFEDYDGDGRDDTPADVHHEAGMGCIDCHGSFDLHGGNTAVAGKRIVGRMEHGVAVRCESCHGSASSYAQTTTGIDYQGNSVELVVDAKNNPLRHVVKEADGHIYLYSRLTGKRHYVSQTKDRIVNNGRKHPLTNQPLYSAKASFAMGTDDGDPATGLGPQQSGTPSGFSHGGNMSCASCHSAWTNTCMGCHLEGEYNTGNNFSNITGERIAFRERNADFVYQSPVPFQLGVGEDNKIQTTCSNTKMFFKYRDLNGDFSKVFSFADRRGNGKKTGTFGALGHNAMMAHSIRGKVSSTNEGPRYCAACHITTEGFAEFETEYNLFRTAMNTGDFGSLDFELLKTHIGKNPGNTLNSPIWVHMVSGLGSGLFLFDENGCPQNPLDDFDGRKGCNNLSPADRFDPALVFFNLDRVVLPDGTTMASSNHPMIQPIVGPNLRSDGTDPTMAGPLGARLIERLTDPDPLKGIHLEAWIDADGNLRGTAGTYVK